MIKGSRQQQIRDFLATQPRGRAVPAVISAGINMPKDEKVGWTIGVMYRDGDLDRVGTKRTGFTYFEPKTKIARINSEHRKKQHAARELERERAKGRMPRDEYLAFLAARRAVVQAETAAKRAAVLQAREKRAKAAKPEPRMLKPKATPVVRVAAPVFADEAEPVLAVKAQTIEEWEKEGGKVEVLAWGASSRDAETQVTVQKIAQERRVAARARQKA